LPNVETSYIPLHFQGGVDARSIRSREATLDRAAGVVIKKSRSAPYLLKLLTTPAAPLRNGTISFMAQLPLLGKEGNVARIKISLNSTLGNSPLRPWLGSYAAPRLYKDALVAALELISTRVVIDRAEAVAVVLIF
jgi:hypothetical protein